MTAQADTPPATDRPARQPLWLRADGVLVAGSLGVCLAVLAVLGLTVPVARSVALVEPSNYEAVSKKIEDPEERRGYLARMAGKLPDDPRAQFLAGEAYHQAREWENAREFLERSKSLTILKHRYPEFLADSNRAQAAECQFLLGETQFALGVPERGIEEWRYVSTFGGAWRERVLGRLRSPEWQEGLDEGSRLEAARLLVELGEPNAARRLLDSIAEMDNSPRETYYVLGLLANASGRDEEAAGYFERERARDPGNLRVLLALDSDEGWGGRLERLIEQLPEHGFEPAFGLESLVEPPNPPANRPDIPIQNSKESVTYEFIADAPIPAYSVYLLAFGSEACGIPAVGVIELDGEPVREFVTEVMEWKAWAIPVDIPVGKHRLSVRLLNDASEYQFMFDGERDERTWGTYNRNISFGYFWRYRGVP